MPKAKAKWQQQVDRFPPYDQIRLLKMVLRGRKKAYPVYINGKRYMIARPKLRDYLRAKQPDTKLTDS
jgi:hypothetical protein